MVANSMNSNFLFYEPVRTFLYERLGEKWQEDMLMLYEWVSYIQNELMDQFLESDAFTSNKKLKRAGDKIEVRFSSGADFQKVYEDSITAQRRSFNSEEHLCKICTRKLLGDRFFFLQGCGHYFCLECLHSLVTVAIKGNKIDAIICSEASCKAQINTLDIKKMGLDIELAEKYD